ncbi:MAG: L,D-transpeptidase family protein, partial [Hyphomicrobium sp.]
MIRRTAVSARAGLLPAIAALCVTGSLVAVADPVSPAPSGSQTPTPVATSTVEDPSTKQAATSAPASAAEAPAPAAPQATSTAPAAPDAAAPAAAVTANAAPTASPAPEAAASTSAAPKPGAPNAEAAKPAEPPKDTAALPDPTPASTTQAAQVLPPADPVLASIREKLPELSKRTNEDELEALSAYYGEMTGTPLWASTSGLTEKGKAIVAEIGRAENWGLPVADFSVPSPNVAALSPEAAADTEIQVALAVLKYARYARGGRINPSSISQLMDQRPTLVPPKTVLSQIATAEKPDEYLTSLHPKHQQFHALREMLVKLRGGDAKEEAPVEDPALAVQLPTGGIIRPGSSDPQVSLLRQRLKVPAVDPASDSVYDETLQQAVREFQRSNNLSPDGIVGNGTRQVLNGGPRPVPQSSDSKIQRILINMERWRWVPEDLGDFYVWDNVPEFLTRVVKNGKVIHTDEIIVGQPSWPTPVFSADMKTVVFRPSWGVPDGIKMKELAPLLRKSSGAGFFGIFGGGYSAQAVLDAYDLRAFANGRQIDANSINWSSVDIRSFSFQQPPGPKNVLGDVKFMFPNSHDVYMHDTPER